MSDPFFHPVSGLDLPRFAGIPTFMRLPHVGLDDPRLKAVQIGLIGAPWDGGTTNRPGPRHGPRQLRDHSTMMRAENGATRVRPFEAANCADLGDVAPNPADLQDSLARMAAFYTRVMAAGILPLTGGGDHLCTLPILRAVARQAPVGLIQFDSHTDLFDAYFGGSKFTHGTPFRRAVEEGLLDPKRIVQIGIRGTMYDGEDIQFAEKNGVRLFRIEEVMATGPDAVMAEALKILSVVELGAGAGPHDIDLTEDGKRLVVTDYFLNEDDFGKVHFEGDHKVHVIKVGRNKLELDRRFNLDFNTAFARPARPHGIAIK